MIQQEQFLQEEFWTLLNQINENDKPQWGLMSAQHMVEHLGGLFVISNGTLEVSPMYDEEKLNRNKAYIIDGKKRLIRNTKAPVLPDTLLPLRFASFEEAKQKLKKGMDKFFAYHTDNPGTLIMHPAFGKLNYEEWCYFHEIHNQYHLDQFGKYEGGAFVKTT